MVLVGNVFPTSLVEREVIITPISIEEARQYMKDGFLSYWGHPNSIKAASDFIGFDLTPKTDRPAIAIDNNLLPSLDGTPSNTVIVISP